MNRYDEIMNKVSLSEEAKERILQKTEKEAVKYKETSPGNAALRRRKYLAAAACFVLIVAGAASVYQRTGFRQDPTGFETLSKKGDRDTAANDEAQEENAVGATEEAAAAYGKEEAATEEEAAAYGKKEAAMEENYAEYDKDKAASEDDALEGEKEVSPGKKALGKSDLPGTKEGPGRPLGLAVTRGLVKNGYLIRCQALDIYQEIID